MNFIFVFVIFGNCEISKSGDLRSGRNAIPESTKIGSNKFSQGDFNLRAKSEKGRNVFVLVKSPGRYQIRSFRNPDCVKNLLENKFLLNPILTCFWFLPDLTKLWHFACCMPRLRNILGARCHLGQN